MDLQAGTSDDTTAVLTNQGAALYCVLAGCQHCRGLSLVERVGQGDYALRRAAAKGRRPRLGPQSIGSSLLLLV